MIAAEKTQPGKIYRPTKGMGELPPGTYYTRPKITTAQWVKRLRKRGLDKLRSWEVCLLFTLDSDPDAILMDRHRRGYDDISGRWEYSRYTLLVSDQRLREVKHRPGYRS